MRRGRCWRGNDRGWEGKGGFRVGRWRRGGGRLGVGVGVGEDERVGELG